MVGSTYFAWVKEVRPTVGFQLRVNLFVVCG